MKNAILLVIAVLVGWYLYKRQGKSPSIQTPETSDFVNPPLFVDDIDNTLRRNAKKRHPRSLAYYKRKADSLGVPLNHVLDMNI